MGYQLRIKLDPRDRLWGPTETLQPRLLPPIRAAVWMPEGGYPCWINPTEIVVGRKRYPRGQVTRLVAETKMDVPVPFPGKGENSYDLDDDAMYSSYGPYVNLDETTQKIAASVMRSRERHGSGASWVPDAGWPDGVILMDAAR